MDKDSQLEMLQKEIERLKKEAEDSQWGLQKTNEGIRTLYKELEKKNQELKRFAEAKSEFVSVVSHELRTPLTSIREGVSQILEGILGETTLEQKEFLLMSLSDIDRLKRIVDNLLDVSRLEAERADLRRERVDIVGLANQVKHIFQSRVKELGLEIKTNFSKEKIEIYIDKDMIIQVFTNLVSNALKFTEHGHILISILDKSHEVECTVSDTGIGIHKESLPLVFGKFQQFGSNIREGEKGTGLGLSICKGIVELHHGEIKVQSEINQGTEFKFILPKLTTDELFLECIHNGLRDAFRQKGVLSIIIFHLKNMDRVLDNMNKAKLALVIQDLRKIAKNCLRRKADVALESLDSILMVLTSTDKKDGSMLALRIKNNFDEYLIKENMNKLVEVSYDIASFPDDGRTEEELLSKIGLLSGISKEKSLKPQDAQSEKEGPAFIQKPFDPELESAEAQSKKEAQDMLIFELAKKDKEIRRLYDELEGRNEELKKIDQLKSDFISTVSHELRTPITIIQEGVSQVMEGIHGAITPSQKEYLSMSFEGIHRLGRVVNELLDISHLEAEKVTLKRELVDLNHLAKEALEDFLIDARHKGLEIKTHFPPKEVMIYVDHERMIQVFKSLLDNAFKFTERGHITIFIIDHENTLECGIVDTGRGIAPENLPKVFGKFQQFDRPHGPGEKGTGLGLAISKSIIEMHGGQIGVDSKPQEGSRFTFSLPRLSVDEVFAEYVDNGIRDAIRFRESLSVIVFQFERMALLRKDLGEQKIDAILHQLNDIVKKSLRRKADLVLNSHDAILMMLPLTTKNNAPMVAGRMRQSFEEFLVSEQLQAKIRIVSQVATFPEDASTYKELLEKVGRS